MDDADFTEIFEHLREKVRETGLNDMDDVASMESITLASPRHRLETYLNMIVNMLKERSGSQAANTYERFIRSIEVDDGSNFKEVTVELSDVERSMYGIDKFSIDELDDYASVIIELQKILDEIRMEPEPPTNNFNQGS